MAINTELGLLITGRLHGVAIAVIVVAMKLAYFVTGVLTQLSDDYFVVRSYNFLSLL